MIPDTCPFPHTTKTKTPKHINNYLFYKYLLNSYVFPTGSTEGKFLRSITIYLQTLELLFQSSSFAHRMIIPSFTPSVFQPTNQKCVNKQSVIFHGISIAVKHF